VRKIVGARVTRKLAEVPAVVLVKRAGMKEAWCLATSLARAEANEMGAVPDLLGSCVAISIGCAA
jgi:hypothetical protein